MEILLSLVLRGEKRGCWEWWTSHGDEAVKTPNGYEPLVGIEGDAFATFECAGRRFYGSQYHREETLNKDLSILAMAALELLKWRYSQTFIYERHTFILSNNEKYKI
uniref:Uncharacterized protein n=1 Tax=Tanacetum cinerariifolium TaxID=118510 RepID=A0A699I7R6_TANCI|nr:hypothetical protein [Tanacetum cinerariifolium]